MSSPVALPVQAPTSSGPVRVMRKLDRGQTWCVPSQQRADAGTEERPLTGLAQARGVGGLVRAPRVGDKIQAWSSSRDKWLDGSVEDVLKETVSMSGHRMPRGAVKVQLTLEPAPGSPQGQRMYEMITPERCSTKLRLALRVTVVAPGAGTGLNGKVYEDLSKDKQFKVDICGKKGAKYDRYPEYWEHGAPPPNLETFAQDLLSQPLGDVLVLGSRGGQVVLPHFWKALGDQIPPAVVINGGCAMNLPGPKIPWPSKAVTILLMGGQDFFRGKMSSAEYLEMSKKCVNPQNSTTAMIYVRQMQHMPQKRLLELVLRPLLVAAMAWKTSNKCPEEQLRDVQRALQAQSWSGVLLFTPAAGVWQESPFGAAEESPKRRPAEEEACNVPPAAPVEVTRTHENLSLWRAAAINGSRRRGAPSAQELAQSCAEAACGYLEGAAMTRHLASQQAEKAKKIEAEIVKKEEELRELRRSLGESRTEERRLLDLAEAQEAEAVAAKADAEEAAAEVEMPPSSVPSVEVEELQPLGACVLNAQRSSGRVRPIDSDSSSNAFGPLASEG